MPSATGAGTGCVGKRPPGSDTQGLQARLYFLASRLEERRQCEAFAESVHFLVGRESGPVGRDFKEDPARLAEIKAPEIEPVDGPACRHAHLDKPLFPCLLLL